MTALPRVPDVLLERYRLGELPPDETDRIAELAREDAALRERLDALDRSDEELRASRAIDAVASRMRRRVGAHDRRVPAVRRRVTSYWIVPAVAAAAIAIAVLARTSSSPSGDAGGERIKGAHPALALYRRISGGSETLAIGGWSWPI